MGLSKEAVLGRKYFLSFFMVVITAALFGCQNMSGNDGSIQSYGFTVAEPAWIRNGEPIVFEETLWHPQDGVEILTDGEVILLGSYRDVQFFVERVDVRPFDRLYTKFARNKFRYFVRESK